MLIGPKGKVVKRKSAGSRSPSKTTISRVMSSFLAFATWVKKETITVYFSKNKKSLTSFSDCLEYLRVKLK